MGRACGSSMPGPGAKGTVAVRNYEAWQSIRLDLDTICENKPVDTRYTFFGQQYDLPVFAGPVGATKLHYGEKYDDQAYNSILVPACAQAGHRRLHRRRDRPRSLHRRSRPSVPPRGRAFLP